MKDNFSTQSKNYATFRPVYPDELYQFVFQNTQNFGTAWDVGTGNGQVATRLAERFGHVHATDISAQQLEKSAAAPNIRYALEPAENCSLPDHSADLVTVGQAIHWFNFEKFFPEIQRVLRPGGTFTAFAYDLLRVDEKTDALLDEFYEKTIGSFWDAERGHIDNRYKNIPFPFEKMVHFPDFQMNFEWSRAHFEGYLGSWSAVAHFKKEKNFDPVAVFMEEVSKVWEKNELKKIRFPVFGRLFWV